MQNDELPPKQKRWWHFGPAFWIAVSVLLAVWSIAMAIIDYPNGDH
jgi:hypothetical protein